MPKYIAIVPLKRLSAAKERLASHLSMEERQALVVAMAEDVIAALSQSHAIAKTIIVTNDETISNLATSLGALPLTDPAPGDLNKAVLHGLEEAVKADAERSLVVHGDLPLLTASDVNGLIETYEEADKASEAPVIGLQTCKLGEGTNIMIVPGHGQLPLHYGAGSLQQHQASAKARGFEVVSLTSANAALDIDVPKDLEALARRFAVRPELSKEFSKTKTFQFFSQKRFLAQKELEDHQEDFFALVNAPLKELMAKARDLRDRGHGNQVTYSRKVFLPLTHLCRDVCHYCTFAQPPRNIAAPYMSVEEAIKIARQGAEMGCKEALFTLGEKPELRYRAAKEALAEMGFASTLDYVAHVAEKVWQETGLLPHINAGNMSADELARLRPVSASMGLMLESASERLCERGEAHYGSPDKHPKARLETLEKAGQAQVPMTTGLLIGIGETREEIISSLLALYDLHKTYGHIQEIIIQNFIPKPDTKMAASPPAREEDLLWAVSMTRLIFGSEMNIQAPPNLNKGALGPLIEAGINDWGGVSPLTPDFVNPEAPWPHLEELAEETAKAGKVLTERLTIYPGYAMSLEQWVDPAMRSSVRKLMDGKGLARPDDWVSGISQTVPPAISKGFYDRQPLADISPHILAALNKAEQGEGNLNEEEIVHLFEAQGPDFYEVCHRADQLREQVCGDEVSFVVNRNINYTNICTYKCHFCAFSKGPRREELGGAPYLLPIEEIQSRALEAWRSGATEVCLQGGIHPEFTGETYLDICASIRNVLPEMHIHAFSPLEVTHGAQTLGLSVESFLKELIKAGLNSLPGTAAEILHDEVRQDLCPDKLSTQDWLTVIETAHDVGLKTTATIMFGHIDGYTHWAAHLMHIRDLQKRTGGFTEFVPLPFVAGEAPLYRKGLARRGPSFREALLMHAVARLVLHNHISNIQTSWVKMGREGAKLALSAGCNDMGGTLTNESITRAAGASHGQEITAMEMQHLIRDVGRIPWQRSTLYENVPTPRRSA